MYIEQVTEPSDNETSTGTRDGSVPILRANYLDYDPAGKLLRSLNIRRSSSPVDMEKDHETENSKCGGFSKVGKKSRSADLKEEAKSDRKIDIGDGEEMIPKKEKEGRRGENSKCGEFFRVKKKSPVVDSKDFVDRGRDIEIGDGNWEEKYRDDEENKYKEEEKKAKGEDSQIGGIFSMEAKGSSEEFDKLVENGVRIKRGGGNTLEKQRGAEDGNEDSIVKDKMEKRDDEGDSNEMDGNPEANGLFGNKLQSIFLRRGNLDCEPEELNNGHPELPKWFAEKVSRPRTKLRKKRALSFADTLISLFAVAPLVIGQWRGIWNMMDLYGDYFPEWLCFVFGTGLHISFAIGRNQLHGRFVEKWRTKSCVGRVAYDFVRLAYIYIFCVACNAQWRGGWMIFSHYLGDNRVVVLVFTVLFTAALMALRSFRNLLAPPFIVVTDEPERVFHFPTRYNVNTRDWSLYILDCAFSVGVVGSLVVFVWRGVWVLFDIHLFPENREYSAIGSLIIGYIIVAVTFCLQPLMRYTCARLEGLARLLAADAFLLLSFLGTVNVWRGIWSVLDLWLLPDDVEMSCWITHIGCFVFLVLLNCSNSILVRGVYIDAEEEEGRCVVFPCHYLRLFFKIERQKKEARRQNLASKGVSQSRDVNPKEVENETLLNCANTMPTIISGNPESLV